MITLTNKGELRFLAIDFSFSATNSGTTDVMWLLHCHLFTGKLPNNGGLKIHKPHGIRDALNKHKTGKTKRRLFILKVETKTTDART